jgi:hypothetical protein
MTRSVSNFYSTDETGAIIPLAEISVNFAGGVEAPIYTVKSGGTPIVQPLISTASGKATFYVQPGVYDVESKDPTTLTTSTFSNEEIGVSRGELTQDTDVDFYFSTADDLINHTFDSAIEPDAIVLSSGFSVKGVGATKWQHNGVTAQTPSQSPTQLSANLLNDASGNQWALSFGQVVNYDGTQWFPLPFGNDGTGNYLYDENGWDKPVLDLINDLSQAYIFDTVALFKASLHEFPDGKTIHLNDREADFTKIAGTGAGNNLDIIASTGINQSIQLPEVSTVSIKNLGGIGDDGVTDDTLPVIKAFEMMQLVNGEVDLLDKMWRYTTPIVISEPITVKGTVNGVHNSNDTKGAILLKDGDFTGIEVTSSSRPTLRDFALKGHVGNGGKGLKITAGGRYNIHRFTSVGHNLDNIEYNNGNLGSWINVITLNSITASGLWVNGAVTPDTNAVDFDIDARDNATFGVNLDNCWNARGYFKTQNNGTGIRINNVRQSDFAIYSEANSVTDIEMTNHANLEGNMLKFLFYGSVTDNQVNPKSNMIMRALENADTRAIFDYMNSKRFSIPIDVSASGSMSLEHPSNAKFSMYFESTGQAQTIELRNTAGLADRENDDPIHASNLNVNGAVYSDRKIFTNLDTSPDISLSTFWLSNNASATTITTFDGGIRGMKFTVLENTGFTTLTHQDYNTVTDGIVLKGGVSRTLVKGETVDFIQAGATVWIEK